MDQPPARPVNWLWPFLAALVVRLVPVLMTIQLGIGLDDMFQYDMLARSLASGNGFRWYSQPDLHLIQRYIPFDIQTQNYDPRGVETSFRAPAYPFFLAGVYLISGLGVQRFFAARLAQAALGALLSPLAYALARRLFPENLRAAPAAAWICAFYPMLILYPLGLATENLFFPLMAAAALFTLYAAERHKWGWAVGAGLLWGLAVLTRSVALPAVVLAVLWLALIRRQWRKALILSAVCLLSLAPWVARNTALHGRFTWVETSLGYNLYVTTHPKSSGTFNPQVSLDLLKIMDDAARNQAGMDAFWNNLRADPTRVLLRLPLSRLGYFFGLERRALGYFYSNNFFGYIPQPWLLLAALVLLLPFVLLALGAALSLPILPPNSNLLLAGAVMLGYMAPHLVSISEERFHLALIPFFAAFAAVFWIERGNWLAAWRLPKRRWLAVLSVILALALLFNWGYELYKDWDRILILMGPHGNQAGFWY